MPKFTFIVPKREWRSRTSASRAAAVGSRGTVVLRTPQGEAETALADADPWGRFRVEGRGHAPFDVLTSLPPTDA